MFIGFTALFTKVELLELDKFGLVLNENLPKSNSTFTDSSIHYKLNKFPLYFKNSILLKSIRMLQTLVQMDSGMNTDQNFDQDVKLFELVQASRTLFDCEKVSVQNTIHLSASLWTHLDDDIITTETGFSSQMLFFIHNMICLIEDIYQLDKLKSIQEIDKLDKEDVHIDQDENILLIIDLLQSIAYRCRTSAELKLYWLFQITKLQCQVGKC